MDHLKWGLAVVTVGEGIPYVKPQEKPGPASFETPSNRSRPGSSNGVHRKMREAF